jgi:hypothetical protein
MASQVSGINPGVQDQQGGSCMQLQKTIFAAPLLLAFVAGCNPTPSVAQQAAMAPTGANGSIPSHAQEAGQNPEPTAAGQSLESVLRKGMAYADFRSAVLANGWKPVVDQDCKKNVVGADFKATCDSDPELDACRICDRLPELSSCSGDAYCGMYFSKGPQKLHAVTFGDFTDWNVAGSRSQISVDGWDFSGN